MIIINDTSPITNLAAIGKLDLLNLLYGSITIPVAVYNELTQPQTTKPIPGAEEVKTLSWIKTKAVGNIQRVTEIINSESNIHRGEAEAIILALELNADILLIDERRGRELAASYNLKVTGLLGVLLQAKNQGQITAVKPLTDRLIQEAEFRINNQLYQTFLKLAEE
mgnify:CR=1 FL=1